MDALHPNLARIAARYDEIIKMHANRQLTSTQARSMIDKLAARDDLGVEWSIDPDSGEWRYRSKDGLFLHATPPSWGLASATPKDMGSGSVDFNKDLHFYEVDSKTPRGLTNSTRATKPENNSSKMYTKFVLPLLIGAALVTIFLLMF